MKTIFTLLLALAIGNSVLAASISGKVYYQNDSTRPITNALIVLRSLQSNSLSSYTTGSSGYYEFPNVAAGTYIIKGTKSQQGAGVNMLDAYVVKRHIQGRFPFNDIQELAADVDGDGAVTWEDYHLIVNHVKHHTPFPVGTWVFLSDTITVTNFKDSNPGGLSGSCAGDVGGIFVPGTRNLPAYPLTISGSMGVSAQESFSVSIKANEFISLSATGLVLNFPSELITIQSVSFPLEGAEYVVEDNQVRLVWSESTDETLQLQRGESLVTFNCISTAAFSEGMNAQFTLEGTTSLVSSDLTELTDARLSTEVIEFMKPSMRLRVYPNPIGPSTTLAFYLPGSGDVTIELFNQIGRMIREYKPGILSEGYHTMPLNGTGLAAGSYYCKVTLSGSNTQIVKVLKTE